MSGSNDFVLVDTGIDQRDVSTKNTGELQITATFDGSSSSTNVVRESPKYSNSNDYEKESSSINKTSAPCRSYQKNGSCYRKNCKFEHIDFEKKNNDDSIVSDYSKGPAIEKQCKYFKSQNGCKFNDDCSFKHYRGEADAGSCHDGDDDHIAEVVIAEEELDEELNQREAKNSTTSTKKMVSESKEKGRVCKYFLSDKGCTQSNCRFFHETQFNASGASNSSQNKTKKNSFLHHNENYANSNSHKGKVSKTNAEKDTENLIAEDKDNVSENGVNGKECNNKISENICKFYKKQGQECYKGEKCPDLHLKRTFVKEEKNFPETSQNHFPSSKGNLKDPLDKEEAANNKKKKKCMYFNTGRGCVYRDSCQFMHIQNETTSRSESENLDTIDNKKQLESENHNKSQNNKIRICRFFKSGKGCRWGSKCNNLHEEEYNQINRDMSQLSLGDVNHRKLEGSDTAIEDCDSQQKTSLSHENVKSQQQLQRRQPKTPQELRSTELTQLEKRWKNNFECLQKEPETVYTVSIKPTDPDWVSFFILGLVQISYQFNNNIISFTL